MNILTVITPSRLGGAEIYAGCLCKWEQANGNKIVLAMKPNHRVEMYFSDLGLDVRVVGISGKLNLRATPRIREIIRAEKIDIVHAHLSTAALWGCRAARAEGVPAAAHVHSLNSATTFRSADKVIAVSRAAKNHLVAQGIPADRIAVVYPGIAGDLREPAADIAGFGEQVVAYAGALREDKGVGVLLAAFKQVIEAVPSARLAIAGEGPDRARFEEVARRAGIWEQVRFLGFREDVPSIFAASKVVAAPSLKPEGFGLVVVEANAAGASVVASDVGAVGEVFEAGIVGSLVAPGNEGALAGAIVAVLNRPRDPDRCIAASRRFSLEASATACMNVFEGLIGSQ
ncbi:MAG TPA: glycosyltransferase [Fimbriimonadales bacterium]|nr:glycosyltransferase [Fimbriimonadales bacterium]